MGVDYGPVADIDELSVNYAGADILGLLGHHVGFFYKSPCKYTTRIPYHANEEECIDFVKKLYNISSDDLYMLYCASVNNEWFVDSFDDFKLLLGGYIEFFKNCKGYEVWS